MDKDDINYYYTFHTLMFSGLPTELIRVRINGSIMEMPGGFVYNQTPINKLKVLTAPKGVILIGKKTRKTLFDPLIFDTSLNNFMQSGYIDDYLE
jgi:hypothetical protein